MAGSRDRILDRLPAAGTPKPQIEVESAFVGEDFWAAFEAQLNALGGRIIDRDELAQFGQQRTLVEEAATLILDSLGVKIDNDPATWDVAVGISVADFAIAETGSLAVSAGPRKLRLSSLVPPVNVMLVNKKSIVAKLSDAIPLISSRSSALITGPSRTADIEGILVRGVHGPGELLVYVFE